MLRRGVRKNFQRAFWHVSKEAKGKGVSTEPEPSCARLTSSFKFFHKFVCVFPHEQARNALLLFIWKRAYFLLR